MKIYSMLFVLLFAGLLAAQAAEQAAKFSLNNRPLPGFTTLPAPGRITLSAAVLLAGADEVYDDMGKKSMIQLYPFAENHPTVRMQLMDYMLQIGLDEKFAFRFEIPYYLAQKLEITGSEVGPLWPPHPDHLSGLDGKKGVGDITVGSQILLKNEASERTLLFIDLKSTTGSKPNSVKQSELASTGTGYPTFGGGFAGETLLPKRLIFSFLFRYMYNMDLKGAIGGPGNSLLMQFRIGFDPVTDLEIGLQTSHIDNFQVFSSWEFSPMVGKKFNCGRSDIKIFGSYSTIFKGDNTLKLSGFQLGMQWYLH